MRHITLAVSLALILTACAPSDPNAPDPFVQNIQFELDRLGFEEVDASALSNQKINAIYLRLNDADSRRAPGRIRLQQEIKVILGWDD